MCNYLDMRPDSGMAKFLSNNLSVLLIGGIQLILWVLVLFTLIIAPPESVKRQLSESKAGVIALSVVFILVCIGFSVLLILGVVKNNKTFVQVYCRFVRVVTALLILTILIKIFSQPTQFGVSRFLSSSFIILLQILTYFIVRNYYLSLIKPPPPSNQNQNLQGV